MSVTFPNYTDNIPQIPESEWKSESTFTYSLLSGIYKVANKNLHSIFPLNENIKECKLNEEDLLDPSYCGENPDVDQILEDFRGPAAYIGIWMSLAVIFTIVGIVWCICNKCCCCSQSKKINDLDYLVNTDSDSDLRNMGIYDVNRARAKMIWKIVVAVLMSFWILGFAFSVFMSFASNEGLRNSIFELYDDLDLAMDDVELYINTTKWQIDATFVTSYDELSDEIRKQFPPEQDKVGLNSEKLSSLILLHSDTLLLKLQHLPNQGIHDLRESNKLNGLGDSLLQLQTTLTQRVNPFLSRIVTISTDIASEVEEALLKTKEILDQNSNDLKNALDQIEVNKTRADLEKAEEDWLDVTGSAIYGSFMGFNLILLIILVSIVIGSVVVWIGKGPAKNIGFTFYRFSIVMMFIVGWIVAFIMITQFVIAGFMTQNACEQIRGMENSTDETPQSRGFLSSLHLGGRFPFADIAQEQEQPYIVPTYPYVVTHCKYDDSAYNSFKLEQVYDVSTITNISDNFLNINSTTRTKASIDGKTFFIKNANSVYSSLYNDLVNLELFKDAVKETALLTAYSGTEALYTKVHFLTVSLLQEIKNLESGEIVHTYSTALNNTIDLVNHYEEFVKNQLLTDIGRCQPIYHAINATLHTFCYKLFAPVATYWWGLQLLLFMFVTVIGTALISERVFK